jgi:UDP-glucose 4-epimerase
MRSASAPRSVLVTGASGLVGRKLIERLSGAPGTIETLVAVDLSPPAPEARQAGVVYETGDVRDPALGKLLERHAADTVVHLAAVVTPGRRSSRELEYEIDVLGTKNVVLACLATGVRQLVYLSSGAAYGYRPDNPVPLSETDPLRGNQAFAYAWHKRLVEQLLEEQRGEHPELVQLVFRPGTILGETVASPITALFERPVIVGVRGSDAPFVLIWDEEVAACIEKGIRERRSGVYNLAGDGALPLPEIAGRLGRRYLPLPPSVLAGLLRVLQVTGLSARGPEQVDFLRYRPVLSNQRLKSEFGFTPSTSDACFERWRRHRGLSGVRGRNVVVTGASSGIGAATARAFAEAGARVALLDLDGAGARSLAAELEAGGACILPIECDVSKQADCDAAVRAVCDAWGGIDVLVNNAGITHVGRVLETKVDVIRRVLAVNFFGAVQCASAALPSLLERRGRIVVMSSIAGFAPLATRAGYAASKHALHGFFESLRAEHRAEGLGVTMVCPSFVRTAIGDRALGPGGEVAGARTGVRGEIEPLQVADAIVLAVQKGRDHVLVPRQARLAWWVSRVAPGVYERLMLRRLRTAGGPDERPGSA